jgi:phosphatidate cytidylyltransferase
LLRIRIITALIILPATLAVVFLAPPWLFRLVAALLLLVGCWEFRRIADLAPGPGWALLALQTLFLAWMLWSWPVAGPYVLWLLAAGCASWLVMFSRLFSYRAGVGPDRRFRWLGFISASGVLSFCCFALFWLRDLPRGDVIVILLFLLIWASDVGAYFSGRLFGRRKLAGAISPRKTWEGVYGGVALAIAAAFLLANGIAGLALPPLALVAISVLTTLSSVGGDLFISVHKRTVGLDDTGTLFPGHGGVLDRYDSLLAGAPFFALAYGLFAL